MQTPLRPGSGLLLHPGQCGPLPNWDWGCNLPGAAQPFPHIGLGPCHTRGCTDPSLHKIGAARIYPCTGLGPHHTGGARICHAQDHGRVMLGATWISPCTGLGLPSPQALPRSLPKWIRAPIVEGAAQTATETGAPIVLGVAERENTSPCPKKLTI